jgi:hypothetical protein
MQSFHQRNLCAVLAIVLVGCSDHGAPTAATTPAPRTDSQPGKTAATQVVQGAPVSPAPPPAPGNGASGAKADTTALPPGAAEAAPEDPGLRPAGGLFAGSVTVAVPPVPQGVLVAYTLDGTDPVPGMSPVYSAPLAIASSTVVKVVAYRPSGAASAVKAEDYTVGEVCVNGGPGGLGTRSRPFNTLGPAVEAALAQGIKTIKVGPDPVAESREITAALAYSGGWNRTFTARTGQRSVINGVAMDGAERASATYGWKVTGAGASGAQIDGFEVRAGRGTYAAALVVDQGAAPRITNCTFVGGPGQYGYGVLVLSRGAPTLEGCTLNGGTAASSFGLAVDDADAVVRSTRVSAGTGSVTGAGVSVTSGKVQVVGSVVAGNGANTTYGIALFHSQGTRIESSTVWGGNGRKASAVFVSEGNPSIVSTTLAAQGTQVSYGVNQNYGPSAPAQLKDVVFEGCATALYHNVNTRTDYTALGPGGALVTAGGQGFDLTMTTGLSRADIPASGAPWAALHPGTGE